MLDKLLFFILGGVRYCKFKGVKIGKGNRIFTNNLGSEPFLIEIGNNVTVTGGVNFITHDGSTQLISDEKGRRVAYGKIVIGNNVFIGVNSIILPNVSIGNNVVIGAGSVINKSIPDNSVAVGNPAKIISTFDEFRSKKLSLKSVSDLDFNLNYRERILKLIDG